MPSNTLLTPTVIAKEALMQLDNNLGMGKLVHRAYKNEFVKVGNTVTIRKPVRFNVTKSATASVQNTKEESTTIVVNVQAHVAFGFSSQDKTLTIEKYSERYIAPAMIQLANTVDADLLALGVDVPYYHGTAGTTPSTFSDISGVAQKLDELAVPQDKRILALNPAANYKIADALKGLFMQKKVAGMVEKGYLGSIATLDCYSFQNVQSFTQGTTDLAGTVNDTVSDGDADVTLAALGTGSVKKGTIVTFADSYQLNPVSKVQYPWLSQHVVTADATISGNAATITCYPTFRATAGASPYRIMSAVPGDTKVVTLLDTHVMNLGFHPNAFALVMCPLEIPDGAAWSARESYNGMSVRVIKDYDFTNDVEQIRLDILYGVKTIHPELACRLLG